MRLLDLCAGIGGFSLAASWLGVEVAGQVEIDPWCRRVLAKHWPNTIRMADVFDVKGNEFGAIDIITAGFPCQPYSVAGKRRGSEDDRAIWPQIARITRAIRPTYCLFENVPGIIGFSDMGLDGVLADLESIGYTAGAVVIPAGAVNALHRRDRVWILAHRNDADEGGHADDRRDGAGGCGGFRLPESVALEVAQGGLCLSQSARPESLHASTDCRCGEGRGSRPHQPEQARQPEGQPTDRLSLGEYPQPHRRGGLLQAEGAEQVARSYLCEQRDDQSRLIRHGGRGENCVPGCEGQVWADASPASMAHRDSGESTERMADTESGKQLPGHAANTVEPGRNTRLEYSRGSDGFDQRSAGTGMADTNGAGQQEQCWTEPVRSEHTAAEHSGGNRAGAAATWPMDAGAYGISPELVRRSWADGTWEIDLPRVVTQEAERKQKLQAAGNAIVPQVAYEILREMIGEAG